MFVTSGYIGIMDPVRRLSTYSDMDTIRHRNNVPLTQEHYNRVLWWRTWTRSKFPS